MKLHQKIVLDNVEYNLVPIVKKALQVGDKIEWEGRNWEVESISGIYPQKEVYEPSVSLVPNWKKHVDLLELINAKILSPDLNEWIKKIPIAKKGE